MNGVDTVAVVGLGEVGKPLFEILSGRHRAFGIDVSSRDELAGIDIGVLHICYPFEIADFVAETARYISKFRPALTIVHSTVAAGTTRAIAKRTGTPVVHSPVRGKHARMAQELQRYTKFVGALDQASGSRAAEHLESAGMGTRVLFPPEATELAKLTETTYFGLLISWAQEVERYCDQLGVSYDEVVSFYREIKYLPPVTYFPGIIGGHCVMPNIKILNRNWSSELLDAIESSNRDKIAREAGWDKPINAAAAAEA
jgi:UDP-N-acetyl-D-mannosaminuronate dehydrogenase